MLLKEVCKLSAGGDVPKERFSDVKTEKYAIPIYSNGIGDNALYGYTDIAKIKTRCVTIAARGTIGYCALRKEPFYPIIRLISAEPDERLMADYLYHYLQTVTFKIPETGIPQLTIPMISDYKIPVPSVPVQERIVEVLDYFEAICSDLGIGLPAEIEKRQKQYEYYRDKLLKFDLTVDSSELIGGGS